MSLAGLSGMLMTPAGGGAGLRLAAAMVLSVGVHAGAALWLDLGSLRAGDVAGGAPTLSVSLAPGPAREQLQPAPAASPVTRVAAVPAGAGLPPWCANAR